MVSFPPFFCLYYQRLWWVGGWGWWVGKIKIKANSAQLEQELGLNWAIIKCASFIVFLFMLLF
jgi:hypothetical protein